MPYRYFIKLAYNGTAYNGWQIQPNGVTVQQLIENGLSVITDSVVSVTGCGRTDAGVHAKVFYAHFDHVLPLAAFNFEQLIFRLNRFLPPDIVVFDIAPVYPKVHARFSAIKREYEYLILRTKDPFSFQQAYFVHSDLDIQAMKVCTAMLIGQHDFQCFSKTKTQVNNYFCNIYSAHWKTDGNFLKFNISADRFLRNMVRAIVGTLLDVGRGRLSAEDFKKIIESHDRCNAGYSVPAKGLTLIRVDYSEEIFSKTHVYFETTEPDTETDEQ